MSQKDNVMQMLEVGKGYDEIEDITGSKRSYIRSIAVEYRKARTQGETPPETNEPANTPTPEEPSPSVGMNFIDDEERPSSSPQNTGKKGSDYHKEWVKAAKYECGHCGATVGKSSDFCPHCGETLLWEGIE